MHPDRTVAVVPLTQKNTNLAVGSTLRFLGKCTCSANVFPARARTNRFLCANVCDHACEGGRMRDRAIEYRSCLFPHVSASVRMCFCVCQVGEKLKSFYRIINLPAEHRAPALECARVRVGSGWRALRSCRRACIHVRACVCGGPAGA